MDQVASSSTLGSQREHWQGAGGRKQQEGTQPVADRDRRGHQTKQIQVSSPATAPAVSWRPAPGVFCRLPPLPPPRRHPQHPRRALPARRRQSLRLRPPPRRRRRRRPGAASPGPLPLPLRRRRCRRCRRCLAAPQQQPQLPPREPCSLGCRHTGQAGLSDPQLGLPGAADRRAEGGGRRG